MAFCNKCGAQLPDGANACPSCGAPVEKSEGVADMAQNIINTTDATAEFDPSDIENNKILSLFAYLGILFLIPLLAAPNSKFARFHTNQGLVLFLADIILSVVMSIFAFIPVVGWILVGIVGGILGIIFLVLMILGIVNAVTGKAKELPVIGKIKILK